MLGAGGEFSMRKMEQSFERSLMNEFASLAKDLGDSVSSNSKDTRGREVDRAALRSANFSDEPWFKAALSGQFTDDEKKPWWERTSRSPTSIPCA